jgi:transcriptional regulator of acetoin/glycerol metabolism
VDYQEAKARPHRDTFAVPLDRRSEMADRHVSDVEAALAKGGAARSAVVASWSRSARLYGLDPSQARAPERMTEAELAQARDQFGPMIKLAALSLDRLFQAVGGVGCCVLLSDAQGVPLDRRGAAADDVTFADWGLWPGTLWTEAAQGTNAIGTCLAEQRSVVIHRDQHFLSRNTILSCMSAPIWGPNGHLAGVLDVSSARADLTEGFTQLIAQAVGETARKIEADTFRAAHGAARIVVVPGTEGQTGLLAVDADDLVIGATRAARLHLSLPDDIERRPRPAADLLGQAGAERLEDAERAALTRALARAGGNASAAARSLGISRATFHRKLRAQG